jgi:hypothetical protein
VGVEALGLEKELVLGLVGKLDDLVFDGGAIARADAVIWPLYMAERCTFSRMMRSVSGVVKAMWQLTCGCAMALGAEAEGRGIGVAGLLLEARPSRWCGRRGAAACRS